MITSIEKFRKQKGLSQAEFGRIAGVTQTAVSLWEDANNPRYPHQSKAQKLVEHFNGELTWSMIYAPAVDEQTQELEKTG